MNKTTLARRTSASAASLLLAAMLASNAAYADTALTSGQTSIDTTGNPELGVISRSTGATALFNTGGIATATGTSLDNGILGPWAFIGTGASTRYATLDGSNNVVSFTGTTTTWAGTINSATTNYEISAVGSATYGGSERVANTIRYTGGAGSVISLGNNSPSGLTINGLINAGTGTLTFQPGGGAQAAAGIHIGATKELVLNAANAAITISSPIHNYNDGVTSFASALTVVGSSTVTLSGASDYTGVTTVNAGTLALGAANRIADASALVLNGGTFVTGGFSETLNTLTVSGSSTINFGSGTSALVFADSSATTWSGSLTLTNFTIGTDTLRFGSSISALTLAQLNAISLSGFTAALDSSGFVTFSAIPEPSTYAALAGVLALGAVITRRRSRQA